MNHTDPVHARRPGAALTLAAAGAALVLGTYILFERRTPTALHVNAEPRQTAARGDLPDYEKANIAIYERNRASVVHITSPEVTVRTEDQWGLSRYFDLPEGTGSGFVWDARGFVVTNFHVVAGRKRVTVRLANQVEYDGDVVDSRADLDIAVVKIQEPPDGLRPVEIGTSSDLKVGQTALAIGNPFGLDQTLTVGVISALDRTIESMTGDPIPGCIQVDAAINPGNSGGVLLDSAGRLIGMNTAIKSPSGVSVGIGFAVPVDRINRIVPRLISGDRELPEAAIGFKARYYQNRVMVDEVFDESGAQRAGLLGQRRSPRTSRSLLGDIILAVDGQPISHVEDIHDVLRAHKPGDHVKLDIVRGLPYSDEHLSLDVELTANTRLPR